MNLKYFFGSLLTIPLLPFMYLDGKRIRSKVPKLPEALHPEGTIDMNSDTTVNIVTLGESTVAGVGVKTHEAGFTGAFAKEMAEQLKANVRWKVYAKSGYNAVQVLNFLVPKITETHIDLLVIGIGGNDAFELNTPTRWTKTVQKLIDQLKVMYPNTPIAFTNMPPIKEFPAFTPLIKGTIGNLVEILGDELRKLTTDQENVYYNNNSIRFETWREKHKLAHGSSEFFSDGVHPSELTYRTWAKDFTDFLLYQDNLKNTLVNTLTKNPARGRAL